MAVLEKLRGWGIVLSILVALPLLLFIIDPSQIMSAVQSISSKYDVGKIAGKKVSYTEFQAETDRLSKIYEMISGNSTSGEEMQNQVREEVWNTYVTDYLFLKNARAAGINVGTKEIVSLTSGEDLSPIIQQFFGEKENVVDFVGNISSDESGRSGVIWDYIKKQVLDAQYMSKYNSLFVNSDYLNTLTLARMVADNNVTADVEYVMQPFTYVTDSTVVVSSQEIQKYYNEHKKDYRQKASRDIEYTVFEVKPSESDKAAQRAAFDKLYEEFTTTDNVKTFLQHNNSDYAYTEKYFKGGDLRSLNLNVDAFVGSHDSGVSEVIDDGDKLFAVRILGTAQVPDNVDLSLIILSGNDRNKADSLLAVLKGGADFAAVAAEHSLDQRSAENGGHIGNFTQNNIPSGLEGAFTAKVGVPYIVTAGAYLYIAKVTEAGEPSLKKQVAIFQKNVTPSNETISQYYNKASLLATKAAGTYKGYRAAIDSNAVADAYSRPEKIFEGTDNYSGVKHSKEITRWAFDNKPGKASNVITVENKYFFVVAVKGASKEGYTPVSEVSESIKNILYRDKYAAKKTADIAAEIEGLTSLEEIADKLGTTVSHQEDLASSLRSRSEDPKFLGAVSVAEEGKITGPVAGSMGTYVFRVNSRDTGAAFTDSDARNNRSQMISYMSQMVIPMMMEDADVKDNRARFF